MTTATACRRIHTRFRLPAARGAEVSFEYPGPGGKTCTMPLRDISSAGLSFLVAHELPGLHEGRSINGATIRVGDFAIAADILVMHLTPDDGPGSVCGALIYPREDGDLLGLQALVTELHEES